MQQRNFALRRGPRPFHHPAAQDGPPSPLAWGRKVSVEQTRHQLLGRGAPDRLADQGGDRQTRILPEASSSLVGWINP